MLQSALEGRLGPGTVSFIDEIPLTHDRGRRVVGLRAGDERSEAVVRAAAPDYFDVMWIRVVAGRTFGPADNASASRRVVLSECFVSVGVAAAVLMVVGAAAILPAARRAARTDPLIALRSE